MKVQRVEWHSYQLVYEYDIPDEDIIQEFGDKEIFKEKLASDDEDFDDDSDGRDDGPIAIGGPVSPPPRQLSIVPVPVPKWLLHQYL